MQTSSEFWNSSMLLQQWICSSAAADSMINQLPGLRLYSTSQSPAPVNSKARSRKMSNSSCTGFAPAALQSSQRVDRFFILHSSQIQKNSGFHLAGSSFSPAATKILSYVWCVHLVASCLQLPCQLQSQVWPFLQNSGFAEPCKPRLPLFLPRNPCLWLPLFLVNILEHLLSEVFLSVLCKLMHIRHFQNALIALSSHIMETMHISSIQTNKLPSQFQTEW